MMRTAFVLCCLIALSILAIAEAKAQQLACTTNPSGCSRQQAYDSCMAYLPQIYINENYEYRCHTGAAPAATSGTYSAQRRFVSGSWSTISSNGFRWDAGCGTGYEWNDVTKKCDAPCSTKPPMTNVRFQVVGGSAGSTCASGCEYAVDLTGGTGQTGLTNIGGVPWYRAASMSPTGASCTTGNVPIDHDALACATQGNLTQCVKPDGQHCATASSGKQFCWQPGENGIKASGNDAATKSPDGTTPKPPPLPPNNGGEWTQTGQSTVTTTINNTTQTSNVTGWQSNYGSQGSGASGDGASGEGNSGSGSGSGLGGNGNGTGDGDDDGDDDGPGAPGAGVDDLYTPTDKTIEGVFSAFEARVGQAPMMDAIDSFFTVSASGSCPTWTVPASTYNEAMTLDWHCSGNVLAALVAIGWVIMAVAAFFAAMWALS